jgi:polyisoprenoid-binding protein YceI
MSYLILLRMRGRYVCFMKLTIQKSKAMKSQTILQCLMKHTARCILSSAFIIGAANAQPAAQNMYEVNGNGKTTSITVSGSSNIHDWNMTSPSLTCNAQMAYDITSDVSKMNVTQLEFSVAVKTLKSGKEKMDDKTYNALKADKYNTITYKLISSRTSAFKKDAFNIVSTGTLTIAGVSREIELNVACQVKPDGTIICVGSKKLKMTDYSVQPPTALLGAISAKDEITISFVLDLKKSLPADYLKRTSLLN